jgi:hypothetical protein
MLRLRNMRVTALVGAVALIGIALACDGDAGTDDRAGAYGHTGA